MREQTFPITESCHLCNKKFTLRYTKSEIEKYNKNKDEFQLMGCMQCYDGYEEKIYRTCAACSKKVEEKHLSWPHYAIDLV